MNKTIQKGLTCVLAGLMTTSMLNVHAATESETNNVVKDESVYAFLKSNGDVESVTVSEWLHSDNGFKNYQDDSVLTDVMNLKSDEKVRSNKKGYEWTTADKDIYYQGQSKKALPIQTKVTYELDGKAMKAEDLVGKKGHLKMTIHLTNTEKEMKNIGGVERPIYTPFVAVTMVLFKQDQVTNIKPSIGTVQTDAMNKIATGVMVPGLQDSFGNLLDGSLDALKSYFTDEMVIEADVEDFSTPTIMMAISNSNDELSETLEKKKIPATGDLQTLQSAVSQLISGAEQLRNGSSELDGGIKELYNGTSQLQEGANQLNAGLGMLVANNEKLLQGMDQMADGILHQVNAQLPEGFPELTWDNYTEVLGGKMGMPASIETMVVNETMNSINAAGGMKVDAATTRQLIYAALIKNPAITQETTAAGVKQQFALTLQELQKSELAEAKKLEAAVKAAQIETVKIKSDVNALNDEKYTMILKKLEGQGASEEEANMILAHAAISHKSLEDAAKDLENADAFQKALVEKASDKDFTTKHKNEIEAVYKTTFDKNKAALVVAFASETLGDKDTYTQQELATAAYQLNMKNQQATRLATTAKNHTLLVNSLSSYDYYDAVEKMVVEQLVENNMSKEESLEMAPLVISYAYLKARPTASYLATTLPAAKEDLQAAKKYQAMMTPDADKVNEAVRLFASTMFALESSSQLSSALTSLTGVDTLRLGLHQYTDGVTKAYEGSKQLKDGVATLHEGAGKLSAGSTQLKNGAQQLYDGLTRFNNEGVAKLTGNGKNMNQLQTVVSILEATKDRRLDYDSYAGLSEGTDGKVKFIYKIDSVKPKETKQVKTTASTEVEEEKENFWTRFIALFQFN